MRDRPRDRPGEDRDENQEDDESERGERDSVSPKPQPEELPRRTANDRDWTGLSGTVAAILLLLEDARRHGSSNLPMVLGWSRFVAHAVRRQSVASSSRRSAAGCRIRGPRPVGPERGCRL